MDGWKITYPLGPGLVSGAMSVSFRESKRNTGKPLNPKTVVDLFPIGKGWIFQPAMFVGKRPGLNVGMSTS